MKVKCNKILTSRPNRKDRGNKTEHLTVGKEYIVLCVTFLSDGVLFYQIEGDAGDLVMFEADQFEILSNYIPSNWEINTKTYSSSSSSSSSTYYLKLSPKKWNNDLKHTPLSFYEEITNETGPLEHWRHEEVKGEVMELYFQEKDLIYREEEEHQKNKK